MFLWGFPFLILSLYTIYLWSQQDSLEFIVCIAIGLLAAFGGFLAGISLFGSDDRVDKVTNAMADGGDILGAVFAISVALLAIPITAIIRAIIRRHHA